MVPQFVHLRIHSEFSLVDGIVRIKPLMEAVRARGMQAVAVTDYCNLFAVVKTWQSALAKGVKPIIGCELPCCFQDKPDTVFSLIALCHNETGFRHLTELVSKAYLEGQYLGRPRVHCEWLAEYAEGLIILSGAKDGEIGQYLLKNNIEKAREAAVHYSTLFPDRFYIEIQRTGKPDEPLYNARAVALADELGLPLVATHAVCFLQSDDYEAHTARVCIHDGLTLDTPEVSQRYTEKQYLLDPAEMAALFHDLPQAIANTVAISERCTVALDLGTPFLPSFPVPPEMTIEGYLSQTAEQGLVARVQAFTHTYDRATYDSRLATELSVINAMGFAGYFLIVADFIHWAKNNGVPVGPGRGSGAGSLVAYALNITDLDPLQYDLLFERFLNPERVSMPDFDIDFCMVGRDRVIAYVAEKYGRMSVSQIITFGSMAAKAVVRDVGRVLSLPYGFVDKIAKLIPFEIGMTLTKALAQEEELARRYHDEEDVKGLLDLALKLEGITRNAGKHAGGVVIAPSRLTDFTAIYCEEGSTQLVSQLDKDDVETIGLVKFDFLGLRTLTIIDWALKNINAHRTVPVDIATIPLDDPATYTLLKSCKTSAVFQLESRGMKELIGRLQPDCFEDIIALVALFRPGPLQSGMVDDFIARKHGLAAVLYPHPDLEPVLKPTYGVILYQEQVMQIAQVLAHYTLGAADLLRRAMGKKKPEEMAKQRTIFTEGALARDVPEAVATQIFDLMEKFAGYGFNKSHSAAYALIAYQTAWLKAHFPAEFMAAVLSADMDNTDKVVLFIEAAHEMDLQILPPSIQHSAYPFTVIDGRLRYGLGAIKGVGEQAVETIVAARQQCTAFTDLYDLCRRVDLRKVNRRTLEAFIKSGALDDWGTARAVLMASLPQAMEAAERDQKQKASQQANLFALLEEDNSSHAPYLEVPAWPLGETLAYEKETLGMYWSGHPVDAYMASFAQQLTPLADMKPAPKKIVTICALVTHIKRVMTKNGKKLVIVGVEDRQEKREVVIFEKLTEQANTIIQTGSIVVFMGEVSQDAFRGTVKMVAHDIMTPETARARFARLLVLTLHERHASVLPDLLVQLQACPGDTPIQIHYRNRSACVTLNAAQDWKINPSDTLLQFLDQSLGADAYTVLM